MDDLKIRQANDSDKQAIWEINIKAWDGCTNSELLEARHGVIDGKGWRQRIAESIAKSMSRESVTTFVAEVNGSVVGYAEAMMDRHPSSEVGVIGHNAVAPEYRRRGIGAALVARVIELLTGRGARVLKVITLLSDEPVRRIYENLGFTEFTRMIYYSRETEPVTPQSSPN